MQKLFIIVELGFVWKSTAGDEPIVYLSADREKRNLSCLLIEEPDGESYFAGV